jgi:hypothetical protein
MDSTLPAAIAHDHRIAEAEALRRLRNLYPREASGSRVSERARALAARAPRLRERSAPSRFCAITVFRAAKASR